MLALQSMVTRRVDVFDPAVVTVAHIEAGSTNNVIPDTAFLEGTIRTLSAEPGAPTSWPRCGGWPTHVAAAHGLTAEFEHVEGYPVTVNDARGRRAGARDRGRAARGAGQRASCRRRSWAPRTSPTCCERVPGAMAFLGACPPGLDPATGAGQPLEPRRVRRGAAAGRRRPLRPDGPAGPRRLTQGPRCPPPPRKLAGGAPCRGPSPSDGRTAARDRLRTAQRHAIVVHATNGLLPLAALDGAAARRSGQVARRRTRHRDYLLSRPARREPTRPVDGDAGRARLPLSTCRRTWPTDSCPSRRAVVVAVPAAWPAVGTWSRRPDYGPRRAPSWPTIGTVSAPPVSRRRAVMTAGTATSQLTGVAR